ncbi:MAG TPA: rhombosortase [Mariprofundaceae bacterium]|nr:rhombosortase [Mariprofundaceae bacterium]
MLGVCFALICWIVWFLPDTTSSTLAFDRQAIVAGQLWRLWTCHVTHFSWQQLSIDSSVVAILGYTVQRHMKAMHLMALFTLALPLVSLAIFWLVPDMLHYRGASGIGAMLWMMAACQMLLQSRRYSAYFWLGIIFLTLLFAKLIGEAFLGMQAVSALPGNVQVAWQAHLFGAIIGGMDFFLAQCCINRRHAAFEK